MLHQPHGKYSSQSFQLPWRAYACTILALAMLFSACGCATLTLATLGTIAGAAGSAVSTGREVYSLGKLDAAEMARFDRAVLAAQQAADDLGLRFEPYAPGQQKDASVMVLPFSDDKGAKVKVRIERRAERLTLIRVDVGWFGSEVTAHLFLTRLRAHLPRTGPPQTKRTTGAPLPEESVTWAITYLTNMAALR